MQMALRFYQCPQVHIHHICSSWWCSEIFWIMNLEGAWWRSHQSCRQLGSIVLRCFHAWRSLIQISILCSYVVSAFRWMHVHYFRAVSSSGCLDVGLMAWGDILVPEGSTVSIGLQAYYHVLPLLQLLWSWLYLFFACWIPHLSFHGRMSCMYHADLEIGRSAW